MWFWFKQPLVGEGALRDEPKHRLRRRLTRLGIVTYLSEESFMIKRRLYVKAQHFGCSHLDTRYEHTVQPLS